MSRHLTYRIEKITANPAVMAKWIAKITGKIIINKEKPFKTKAEASNKINREGKKLMKFSKTIESGIRYCGKADSLIRFLLSTKLVTEQAIESLKKRQGNKALIKYRKNGASSI